MKKKEEVTFSFRIDSVEHLQDGRQMFLACGHGKDKTRVVTVKNGRADFGGETFQREVVLRRDPHFVDYFRTTGLKVRVSRHLSSITIIALLAHIGNRSGSAIGAAGFSRTRRLPPRTSTTATTLTIGWLTSHARSSSRQPPVQW
jgi:hypothetical protein